MHVVISSLCGSGVLGGGLMLLAARWREALVGLICVHGLKFPRRQRDSVISRMSLNASGYWAQ